MHNNATSGRRCAICLRFVGLLIAFGSLSAARGAPSGPLVFSNSTSTRAIALESVTMRPEPFPLTASVKFSNDTRTRIALFGMNFDLLAGEGANALSADAEDAAHNHYPMNVEYIGPVPGFEGIFMVIVRLNDAMGDLGDVLIRLNLHGMSSNRVRVGIGHVGGGPADDPGAAPTPAPDTPPAPVTPLTIDQYRAQFSNPALAAGPDAVRFLEQVTWGPTNSDIQHLRSIGLQAYLSEQFNGADSGYPSLTLYPQSSATITTGCDSTCVRDNYSMYPLQTRFFQNALTGADQLRQRVAFALHQLIPVAGAGALNNEPSWVAPYLQTMDKDAFSNFRDVLYDITLNPAMGRYLDMVGNSRVNPNENYAREVMQLFSIGVDQLNPDGTPVLDANGNRVPTYDQSTITNLARVFTGWVFAPNKTVTIAGNNYSVTNYIDPMVLSNNTSTYDIAAKTLLPDINNPAPLVLPGCSNCASTANFQFYKMNELNAAIDNLFNHSNTGPYLCTQLIHQLVDSNPSPAYVARCAASFANNGQGVRGDMKTVITAILLDPEARGDLKSDPNYGHLREPVLFIANLQRAFNATSDYVLASSPFSYTNDLGQDLYNPPTVFSYYPADYGLPGTNLFGPEFGILSTQTTLKRANFVNTLFLANNGNGIPASLPNRPSGTQVNISAYTNLAGTPQQLVDALDALLMHGSTSQSAKTAIVQNVSNVSSSNPALRAQTAIYLVASSSQYQVER